MNDTQKKLKKAPSPKGPDWLGADLEKLAVEDSELTLRLESLLADEQLDRKSLAQLLRARSSAMQLRIALFLRWMDLIDGRVSLVEARLSDLANHLSQHDETLNKVCFVLKELDDPYGLGQSSDERILGDVERNSIDDPDG